jgi:hypothetical protein
MRIAFTLGALLALGSTAHAGGDVGVVIAGESWMQPQLTAQIEGWLGQHGHSLVQLPPDALDSLKQCFATRDLGCARGIIEKLPKPTSVLYAGVDAKNATGNTPDVTLTAYWFDKGREAIAERQTCQHCTDQSLRTTADDVLKKLIGGADPGHVKLKSAPPGATIKIDGQAIGVAPLDWDLTPGKHTIEMTTQGRKPASKDIIVTSNKSDLIVMTLTSDSPDNHDDTTGSSGLSPWIPRGIAIGGGAALAVGIGLYVLSPGPDSMQRYYTSYKPPGIGIAIGGAAVGLIGVSWLLFWPPKAASAPIATFTSDSAYIGWLGRF